MSNREPDWLTRARAEGMVLNETAVRAEYLEHPEAARAKSTVPLAGVLVPLPPSTNHLYRNAPGKGRVSTETYKAWQASAATAVSALATPGAFPVDLLLLIIPGKHWRENGDVANREKAITDLLVSQGVLPDDSCRYIAGVRIGLAERTEALNSFVRVSFGPRKEWWLP